MTINCDIYNFFINYFIIKKEIKILKITYLINNKSITIKLFQLNKNLLKFY